MPPGGGASVLASAKTAWGALCIFLAVDSVSVMLLGVNRAIGVQSRSALCVLVILWLMGLPIVFLRSPPTTRFQQYPNSAKPTGYLTLCTRPFACRYSA